MQQHPAGDGMLIPLHSDERGERVRLLNVDHIIRIDPVVHGQRKRWEHVDNDGSRRPFTRDELNRTVEVSMVDGKKYTGTLKQHAFRRIALWAFATRWSPVAAVVVSFLAMAASAGSLGLAILVYLATQG